MIDFLVKHRIRFTKNKKSGPVDENAIYQSLRNYGAETPFWVLINQATGYQNGDNPRLAALAIHIFLTALTRTVRKEHLAGLDAMMSTPHQAWCYDFVSEWLRTENDDKLYEISRYVENEMRLAQRLSKLEVDDIVDAECLPCINEIILLKLMTNISDHIIQPEMIRQIVEKRRTKVWYDFMACYYDGIYQVALMQAFFDEHASGFHI